MDLQFSFDVGILTIFGQSATRFKEQLKENYGIVDKGYNSFPTNIPGTLYNNAILVMILSSFYLFHLPFTLLSETRDIYD